MLPTSQGSNTFSPNPDLFSDQGGYYIFPNGLIMQWGAVPVDDTENVIYEEWNKYTIRTVRINMQYCK